MRKKWIVHFAAAVMTVWSGGLFSSSYDSAIYHTPMPIGFSDANIPFTEVEIEGRIYFFEIDSGCDFPLSMRSDLLERIEQKESIGTGKWRDVKGNWYETPAYLIQQLNLGDLEFSDVLVQQEDDDFLINTTFGEWDDEDDEEESKQGTIGLPLLEEKNILFDFSNYIFLVSNDFEQLEEDGYDLGSMIQVPFEAQEGIVFSVETDLGTQKLMIDTGCTLNLVRASLAQGEDLEEGDLGLPLFTTSQFILGGQDFGSMGLHLFDIASEFDEIDGLLGMDFLDQHVLYFDFENGVAYIGKAKL